MHCERVCASYLADSKHINAGTIVCLDMLLADIAAGLHCTDSSFTKMMRSRQLQRFPIRTHNVHGDGFPLIYITPAFFVFA